MHFICRSFLGHTEENSWSQYWENEPDDLDLVQNKGHLFALVNIVSDQDSSTSDLGHRIIDDVNERYFSSQDSTIPLSLKNTVETVVAHTQNELADISLVVAIIHQSQLYIAMYNSGYGYLVRGKSISKIVSGQTGQVTMISGRVNINDLVFFCTSNFHNNLTSEKLKSYLSLPTIQEIEESILSSLYTLSQQPTLAGLLVGIYDEIDSANSMAEIQSSTNSSPPILSVTPAVETTVKEDNPHDEQIAPPPSPSVYVTMHDSTQVKKRRRINIAFSLIILVALSISIFFGSKRNRESKIETEYQDLKSQYNIKIDNAKVIKNINLTEAQSLAKNAKDIATKLQTMQIHSDEVKQFIASADEILSQTGSADSYQPQHFYDSTLINSEAQYSQILISKNNLFLLDAKNGMIDRLDVSTKSQQKIIKNEVLKNTTSFTENNGQIFFLVGQKIFYVDGSTISQSVDIVSQIKDFQNGKIAMWNGSLYLLGSTSLSASIWKFTPSKNSLSTATEWVKKPSEFPTGTTSFAINGQVWVITNKGEIIPYNRGDKGEFKSQITSTLTEAGNLVTALNSETLAFTEKDTSVYVYRKDGSTASSYNFGNRRILSIALESTSNRLFVLCADKQIYQISL